MSDEGIETFPAKVINILWMVRKVRLSVVNCVAVDGDMCKSEVVEAMKLRVTTVGAMACKSIPDIILLQR
jgi:hypothetical protein